MSWLARLTLTLFHRTPFSLRYVHSSSLRHIERTLHTDRPVVTNTGTVIPSFTSPLVRHFLINPLLRVPSASSRYRSRSVWIGSSLTKANSPSYRYRLPISTYRLHSSTYRLPVATSSRRPLSTPSSRPSSALESAIARLNADLSAQSTALSRVVYLTAAAFSFSFFALLQRALSSNVVAESLPPPGNMGLTPAEITEWFLDMQTICNSSSPDKSLQQLAQRYRDTSPTARLKLWSLVNARHPDGWTALHVAAINGSVPLATWLLDSGADINAVDLFDPSSHSRIARLSEFSSLIEPDYSCAGWTPLHYACAFSNVKMVELLLARGAQSSIRSVSGLKPDNLLSNSKESKAIQTILKRHSADVAAQRDRIQRIQFPLEGRLEAVMVGQKVPISMVSRAIRSKQNGWADEDKPLVFFFLGSSGVGKTMLAKCLADSLVGDEANGFIRIDMSEYSHEHEVSKFIGAPPGYVGYEQGGQLTDKLAKCPNAVVLLDEIEKAHPDVCTVLLQVFDEGRLTDGKGRTIDCKGATFIMTSNLVQDEIEHSGFLLRPEQHMSMMRGGTPGQAAQKALDSATRESLRFVREVAQPILKKHFKRDEFLGRINEFIVFHSFSDEDIQNIARVELNHWRARAKERHSIKLEWDEALEKSLQKNYNSAYGFRSIKYAVERDVVSPLAQAFEQERLKKGGTVRVTVDDNDMVKLNISDK